MKTLQILILMTTTFPIFGQKINCTEFTEYDWKLYSSSPGDPFITSDTVVIMLDEESIENHEWNVLFDSNGTIELIKIDFEKAARAKEKGPFYEMRYNSTLNWDCDGKILNVRFEDKVIQYRIGKMKNNLLTFIKYS